jgi:ATP-dependent protease ClpP protease subunit
MNSRRKTNQPNVLEQLNIGGPSDHFSRPVAWEHTFYLGPIEEPSRYYEWFETIRSASPNDQIVININSPGGNYFTALQFRRVMQESDATVVCCIEGECHSAASIIFLSGDVFSVSEGSSMLCHDYNSVSVGKGSELIKQIQHEKSSIDEFITEVYEHFMTPEEIKLVLLGQDQWFNDVSIMERTKTMAEARSAEYEAFVKAQEESKPKKSSKKK